MLGKYNRYKILKIFLFNPNDNFRLREISRLSGISPPSVMNYLKEFEQEELIESYEKRGVPFYKSNLNSEYLAFYKKLAILYELQESGLIDFLWDKLAPEAIILYGSYAKAEFTEDSDIDLFIIGKENKIDLTEFEKKLGIEVHLMFEEDIKKIQKHLRNNLCNGITLKGYFKVC